MNRAALLLALYVYWSPWTSHAAVLQRDARFSLRLIELRTEAQAVDILGRLKAGQAFAQLARSYSIEPSARSGGYVGTILFSDLRPEFQAALDGVPVGEVSRIARVGGTYFILQLGVDEQNAAIQLMDAVMKGDTATVSRLAAAGVDVNTRFENGLTVLMNAAFQGRVEVVRRLLAAGSDVNATFADGSTALMAAAVGGHTDVVRELIAAGAPVKSRNKIGATALTEAAHAGHIEVVRLLLTSGAEVNASLADGSTALMAAALAGHSEVIRELAAAGADLNAKDNRGWTALTHAASSTKTAAVKMLIDRGAGVSAEERRIFLGGTYVNEYYVSNDASLLNLAAAEFQRVLDANPSSAAALLWMGGVNYLRWDPSPSIEQFRKANTMLVKSANLGSNDPVLQYWVGAVNSTFVTRSKGLGGKEASDILDEGIEYARKAIALDPAYSSAMAYLSVLYAQRADRADSANERRRFLELSEAAAQDVLRSGNRPPRPNDQFSRPSPPAAPSLPVAAR